MAELKYKDITEKIIGASFEGINFWVMAFRKLFIKERWRGNCRRQGLTMQEKLNKRFITKNFRSQLEREGLILSWKERY